MYALAFIDVSCSGQGAQMGIEDAGTMAWLLRELCVNYKGQFTLAKFDQAVEIYEKIRIPRTGQILDCSKELGRLEEMRGDINAQEELELMIQGELVMNGTLPIMFQGATHHYREAVKKELRKYEIQEEKEAMDAYLPGVFEYAKEEEAMDSLRKEREYREAFEQLLYGGTQ